MAALLPPWVLRTGSDVKGGWVKLGIAAGAMGVLALLKLTLFAPQPLAVRVFAVETGRVEATVTNSRAGTVRARRRAKLSPEIGGRVVAIPHPEGDRVRKGQLLLKVDDALQAARLEVARREQAAAEAEDERACLGAERAQREWRRTESLACDGIVSADVLDQVASSAKVAQAACEASRAASVRAASASALARAELAKTALPAPFDGVVAELSIETGEWTTPSPPGLPIPPVLDLIDNSSIYVSAPMDEVDAARLQVGQDVRLTVDSHPGASFPGRLVRIAPYVLDVEAQNRTVEIEAELADASFARTLLPGTSADVEVILSVLEGALRVPTSALLEGSRVLVLEQGRLQERAVTAGMRNWDFTEVREGLRVDDRIVVSFDLPEIKAGARARAAP
jgi:HlyD family secretion protein